MATTYTYDQLVTIAHQAGYQGTQAETIAKALQTSQGTTTPPTDAGKQLQEYLAGSAVGAAKIVAGILLGIAGLALFIVPQATKAGTGAGELAGAVSGPADLASAFGKYRAPKAGKTVPPPPEYSKPAPRPRGPLKDKTEIVRTREGKRTRYKHDEEAGALSATPFKAAPDIQGAVTLPAKGVKRTGIAESMAPGTAYAPRRGVPRKRAQIEREADARAEREHRRIQQRANLGRIPRGERKAEDL